MKVKYLGDRIPGKKPGSMKDQNEITLRNVTFKKGTVKDLSKETGGESLFAKVSNMPSFEVVA